MRRYGRSELERFLEEVARGLEQPAEVIVIGGAAAIVRYGVPGDTQDIDTWTVVAQDLALAVARAREATGLPMPFSKSGVADAPYDFESRLERALPHIARLQVWVPERHDLVLMKTVRCYERDLQAIEAMHRISPLDADLLLRRFEQEMGHVVGDPVRLRSNFLAMVERMFPERLEAVEARLVHGGSDSWER